MQAMSDPMRQPVTSGMRRATRPVDRLLMYPMRDDYRGVRRVPNRATTPADPLTQAVRAVVDPRLSSELPGVDVTAIIDEHLSARAARSRRLGE